MTNVELSIFIEANYPANKSSIARRNPLFGFGLNDAHHTTRPMVDGVRLCDPAYISWFNMLKRVYDYKFHTAQPTYSDVTVCKEWNSFSAFRAWWLENYHDGWHLDKDILVVGNREYGPDACIYVPRLINAFINDCGALRGDLPIGVSIFKQTEKYRSRCRNPITGKQRTIGLFNTPASAHDAWLTYKLSLADQLKPEMDSIDKRIYPNVVTIIKAAR